MNIHCVLQKYGKRHSFIVCCNYLLILSKGCVINEFRHTILLTEGWLSKIFYMCRYHHQSYKFCVSDAIQLFALKSSTRIAASMEVYDPLQFLKHIYDHQPVLILWHKPNTKFFARSTSPSYL